MQIDIDWNEYLHGRSITDEQKELTQRLSIVDESLKPPLLAY